MNTKYGVLCLSLCLGFALGCGDSAAENNSTENNGTANNSTANNGGGDNNGGGENNGACPIDTSFDDAVTWEGSTFPPFTFDHPPSFETFIGGEGLNDANQWTVTLAPPDRGAQPEVQIDVLFSAELKDTNTGLGEEVHSFDYGGEMVTGYGIIRPPSGLANFDLPYEGQFVSGTVRVVRTVPECDAILEPTLKSVLDSLVPNDATTFEPVSE